jgi:hypothetical protein
MASSGCPSPLKIPVGGLPLLRERRSSKSARITGITPFDSRK